MCRMLLLKKRQFFILQFYEISSSIRFIYHQISVILISSNCSVVHRVPDNIGNYNPINYRSMTYRFRLFRLVVTTLFCLLHSYGLLYSMACFIFAYIKSSISYVIYDIIYLLLFHEISHHPSSRIH